MANSASDEEIKKLKPAPDVDVNGNEIERTTVGIKVGSQSIWPENPLLLEVFGLINLVNGKIEVLPKRVKLRNTSGNDLMATGLQNQLMSVFAVTVDPGTLPYSATPLRFGSILGPS